MRSIEELAREAGFRAEYVTQDDIDMGYYAGPVGRRRWFGASNSSGQCECPDELERFAALVRAQALEEAAMIVEDMPQNAWIAYAGMGDCQVMLKKSGISHIDASAVKLVTTKAAAAAIRAAQGAAP